MKTRRLDSVPRTQTQQLRRWPRLATGLATLLLTLGCSDDRRPQKVGDPTDDSSNGDEANTTSSDNTTAPTSDAPNEHSTTPDSVNTNAATQTTVATGSASSTNGEPTSQAPTQRFEGLPIPIAYVGMTDTPGGVTQFATSALFADCPTGLALGWNQQMMTGPLWSDCAAQHITTRINEAFQELLDTDQVFFESVGFSTHEAPEHSVFTSRDQVSRALQELDSTALNVPGQITAIISNWTHSIGGLAPYDQALDDQHGIVLAISQVTDAAVIHEVGHALGFRHTDEDPEQTGVLHYDFCEPLSAPILAQCNCEMNLMEAISGVCATQCGDKAYSFDTPTHGEYFRDVASCWFGERRFAGDPLECDWPGIAHCVGYENTGLACECLSGTGTIEIQSCVDASVEEITQLLETCDTELAPDNLCMSFVAYPGMYCFEHDGDFDCACLSDDTPFTTGKPCAEFTAAEIYATCLDEQPKDTCQTTLADLTLTCVETNDSLNCICSDTGAMLDSANTKCSDVDLTEWILSCPED